MSDSPSLPSPPRRLSLAGFSTLAAAGGLAIAYRRLPFMHEDWPDWFHPIFWVFVAGLVLASASLLASPFVPQQWLRRIPTLGRNRVYIPREGIGYLLIMAVLFVGSTLTQENRLLLVFAAMAGPFIVNGSITYTMLKNVQIRRRPPPRAMASELFSVEVDLANESAMLPLWMMVVQDVVAFGHASWAPTILFTRVPPKTVRTSHYQIRLMQRGRYRFGPVQVISRFPLGLVERGCLFRDSGEMLIYPRVGRLSPRWKRRLIGASELIETPQPRSGVFDDEYHHLREYRAGDNTRAIHWRSSARRNMLIVREYQQNREHHLLVLVDLWAGPGPRDVSQRRTEQVLSFATTLACEHRRECRGATLTFVACGTETWRWEARANSQGLETLLDRLAVIEAGRENGFAKALVDSAALMAANTRIVVVSPRREADAVANGNGHGPARVALSPVHWLTVDDASFGELVLFADDRQPARGQATLGPATAEHGARLMPTPAETPTWS